VKKVFERLNAIESKYEELTRLLSDPKILAEREKFREYSMAQAQISGIVALYRRYKKIICQIDDTKKIALEDREIGSLATSELEELAKSKASLEQKLRTLLTPADPSDQRNTVVEIRAGTGGDEAALFAADLFRMYSRYAESQGWKVEIMSNSPTRIGGFKEVIFMVSGEGVYGKLKYESGVHRVQRIPVTEAAGRVHTSAVAVAVLPEAKEVDVKIDLRELSIETFRASGAGGQHVNVTDSAIRITHIPTGIVVQCQDERSQHKNKARAMQVLRARLLSHSQREKDSKRAEARKLQVGTGDRSEKIRTYNFPQDRVTDHRIGLTLHRLDAILDGDLDGLVSALVEKGKTDEATRKNSKELAN
jgi:peptide chain release factor 1